MTKFDSGDVAVRKRNRLPHWDSTHGIYFVTWHIDDALPLPVQQALRQERDYERHRISVDRRAFTIADRVTLNLALQRKYEKILDAGLGRCVLRNPSCASIVAGAIEFFNDERYQLYSWSVMPNHVHVVLSCLNAATIDRVLHSWKSYTSKEINKVLGRSGVLWQEDYFDRLARDDRHFLRILSYVLNNPAKAGLTNWQFAKSYPERIAAIV